MATLTSTCNTTLSQTISMGNNHPCDASFPPYLNCSGDSFVLKLDGSNQNLNPHEYLYLARKKLADREIGVFGAEKYFNGGTEEENQRIGNMGAPSYRFDIHESVVATDAMKTKPQLTGTSSVQSESSRNSKSALLHNVQRNPPRMKAKRLHFKSILSGLGCSCYCSDKNSVDVVDDQAFESTSNRDQGGRVVVQGKTIPTQSIITNVGSVGLEQTSKSLLDTCCVKEELDYKKFDEQLSLEDCFSFPILDSKTPNLALKLQLQAGEEGELLDDKPRKSLEVFGSPTLEKGKGTSTLEKKLTVLTWDANSREEEAEIPPTHDGMCNDTESDASSDLFEIKSFTNNANLFLCRQASDEMSSCVTPTTCYAPSEASIEWSVVTVSASAADFSAVSDNEDLKAAATMKNQNKVAVSTKPNQNKEITKGRTSLLGCKSQKAVRVAGDAYRTTQKAGPDRGRQNFPPVTMFPAGASLTGCDSINGPQSQLHTARNQHLLFIQ